MAICPKCRKCINNMDRHKKRCGKKQEYNDAYLKATRN